MPSNKKVITILLRLRNTQTHKLKNGLKALFLANHRTLITQIKTINFQFYCLLTNQKKARIEFNPYLS